MTRNYAFAIACPEKSLIRTRELPGCECVAEMRQTLDALQKTNQELRQTITELELPTNSPARGTGIACRMRPATR